MSKLLETVTKFPQTQVWNDSCSYKELEYAVENGAVGATTNPVIVLSVLQQELKEWEPTIEEVIAANPTYSEDDVAWEMIKRMGAKASTLLMPKYKETNGVQGRLSFQTNAKFYNNAEKMVEHAVELAAVVENSQIKAPTSKAGVEAFEEMTYRGISINATVSFTCAQAIQVAEAVERGLERRRKEGLPTEHMNPVCTIMVGRVDDYMKKAVAQRGMLVEPEILEHAGVAVMKNAYKLYQERNYTTKLLAAAYRNVYHWTAFVGGDIVLTIPYGWQKKFNESNFAVEDNMSKEVDATVIAKLKEIPEFIQAFEEDGLSMEEFETFGAFKDTINQFLNGYDTLCKLIRSYMVK